MNLKVLAIFLVALFAFATGKFRLFFFNQFPSIFFMFLSFIAQKSCGEGTEAQLQANCDAYCRTKYQTGQCFKAEFDGLLQTICICHSNLHT